MDATQSGDTGGGPDKEYYLLQRIHDLENKVNTLEQEKVALQQERDNLSVEVMNSRAGNEAEVEGDTPGVSADAARKRLHRVCKRATDGSLGQQPS